MTLRTALLCVIASVAIASPLRSQARIWQPDDRVTISAFGHVVALAYNRRHLFAATPNGLEIYDVALRRWDLPSTIEDGYPVHEQPAALVYDRSQGGVWLLTASGNAYLRSDLGGRWDMRAPFAVPRELIERARSSAEADPAWRVLRGTVSLDPTGRRWPVTRIVDAETRGLYWVGTAGGNIIRADTRSLASEWLSYGTLSRGVGALAIGRAGDIWLGGDGQGPREGIAHGDRDLQRWTLYDAFTARAPRRQINRILVGDTVWTAAVDGVHLLPEGARSWRRIEDLPDDHVRSLERTAHGVWAGTSRGLALIDVVSLRTRWRGLEGRRINGLAARNDTLWIATHIGLWIAVSDGNDVRVAEAPGIAEHAWLRMRINSVARVGGGIAALANNRVYVFESTWADNLVPQARAPHDLRSSGESLFILGRDGVEEFNFTTKVSTYLSIPFDIPEGPVRDAARTGEFVWVATPMGATRLRLP